MSWTAMADRDSEPIATRGRPTYVGPIVQALVTQAALTLFCCGFKDGGYLLAASMVASGWFWFCAIAVIFRSTSDFGRRFVRWGLTPIVLAGTPLLWPVMLRL